MDCLEIKKVEEFLEKELGKPRKPKYQRLVLLTDSKGNYLKTEIEKINPQNLEIVWWTQRGRNTSDGVKYLIENIQTIRDDKHTLVLFWHFTCDITIKQKEQLIHPRYSDSADLIDNIKPYLGNLREIHTCESNIDIGLLEAPPIFTREWNRQREAIDWDVTDDSGLHGQIAQLNEVIRSYNEDLSYRSPRFECDFQHQRRNRKKGAGVTKTRVTLNPILLKDGIHPVGIVARKWMLKILHSMSE